MVVEHHATRRQRLRERVGYRKKNRLDGKSRRDDRCLALLCSAQLRANRFPMCVGIHLYTSIGLLVLVCPALGCLAWSVTYELTRGLWRQAEFFFYNLGMVLVNIRILNVLVREKKLTKFQHPSAMSRQGHHRLCSKKR